MSTARLDIPCPHCGSASKARQTHRDPDGSPVRFRTCEIGHKFIHRGGAEAMKRETKPKARREVKRYAGPILTQWRGQPPIWDGVMRSVP